MAYPAADELLAALDRQLAQDGADRFQGALELILNRLGCATGTLHRLDPSSGELELLAQRGVPPQLLPKIQRIPIGKGLAGLAAQRREPVQVCNLQTDDSGAARPAARETGMKGSIAVPILVGNDLRGVLGVAKEVAHEFDEQEIALITAIARHLGAAL